jgi:SynChlorMet cassette radical SAM/SPASM protein ScmF
MSPDISLPKGIPPLRQYYFYLTAGCNLACQHCWLTPAYQPEGSTGGHLDFDLFQLAIEEGIPLGLTGVKLTGGEPLLHPDFLRIVDFLYEKDIPVTMETNGTLVSKDMAVYLKEKSTLHDVSVSLDGAQGDTHDTFRGVKGSFARACQGIHWLVEAGYHPQIIMSLHTGNINEIETLVRLAEELQANSVKFNIIQPSGRGEKLAERGRTLDIQKLIETGRWVEQDLQKKVSIPLYYSHPMAFQSLKRLLAHGADRCGIFNILGILANGHMAMCGIGMEIEELRYGTLGKDTVAQVWCEHPMLKLLREQIPKQLEGVCGECLFRWQCMGSCIADNYHKSRRMTSAFWFCQQASETNLFPQARKQPDLCIQPT